nr:hypothetical protein; 35539-34386 [Arabidopsis thaliana]
MARKRSKSSSSLSIPLDIATDIFLRLPAKSVVRFSCVAKHWSSITTAPYFTNSFETRPNLLFFFKEADRFFVVTVPKPNRRPNESVSHTSSQILDSYQTPYPKHSCFTIKTESVHGLICFQRGTKPIVWNPTMRKFKPLRKPDKSWESLTVFLGYDPLERTHKVVAMPCDKASDECRILTLGSADQESWRTVKTNYKHHPSRGNRKNNYGPCRCINGVLYYLAEIDRHRLIGKFAFLGHSNVKNSLPMWVLEGEKKGEWSTYNFLPLSHYDRRLEFHFKLIGITNDGELIYVPNTVFKTFEVIYIDPIRKTFSLVKYEGVADKGFRQRNGLGEDKPLRGIQYSPNHVETLLSL